MRDCALGPWDQTSQRRSTLRLSDPVPEALAQVKSDNVYVSRLDAAIRACGVAASGSSCVQTQARELLLAMLDLQRRGLLHEPGYDDRGTHTLIAARALLTLAAAGDDGPLHEHVAAYADNETLLGMLLRAVTAAAEESPTAADTARRIWPSLITQVLDLHAAGHNPFSDDYFGQAALAALIPTRTSDIEFLYREVEQSPIEWRDARAWQSEIEAWLRIAVAKSQCVDSLIALIETLPITDQVAIALPWVRMLVLPNPGAVVRRSYSLSRWLSGIRPTAVDLGVLDDWQELVDALVVAGDIALAPYSE
jgi:hypothetical protein